MEKRIGKYKISKREEIIDTYDQENVTPATMTVAGGTTSNGLLTANGGITASNATVTGTTTLSGTTTLNGTASLSSGTVKLSGIASISQSYATATNMLFYTSSGYLVHDAPGAATASFGVLCIRTS